MSELMSEHQEEGLQVFPLFAPTASEVEIIPLSGVVESASFV
jgi:hypothetical protein